MPITLISGWLIKPPSRRGLPLLTKQPYITHAVSNPATALWMGYTQGTNYTSWPSIRNSLQRFPLEDWTCNAWCTLANFCCKSVDLPDLRPQVVNVHQPYRLAYISQLFCKSSDLPTYAQKLSMYTGLKTNSTKVWPIRKSNRSDFCCQCMSIQKLLLLMYARTQRLL